MLDFRVETFLEVCKDLNFTRAAQRLNLTQPAVSQHIRWLEEAYGVPLFVCPVSYTHLCRKTRTKFIVVVIYPYFFKIKSFCVHKIVHIISFCLSYNTIWSFCCKERFCKRVIQRKSLVFKLLPEGGFFAAEIYQLLFFIKKRSKPYLFCRNKFISLPDFRCWL